MTDYRKLIRSDIKNVLKEMEGITNYKIYNVTYDDDGDPVFNDYGFVKDVEFDADGEISKIHDTDGKTLSVGGLGDLGVQYSVYERSGPNEEGKWIALEKLL